MGQDFLKDMLESHPEPSPELGICLCGHQGKAGHTYCFICLSNIYQECGVIPANPATGEDE